MTLQLRSICSEAAAAYLSFVQEMQYHTQSIFYTEVGKIPSIINPRVRIRTHGILFYRSLQRTDFSTKTSRSCSQAAVLTAL